MGRRDGVFRVLAECKAVTRSKRKDGWRRKSENSRAEGQSGRQGLVSDTKRDLLASETTRQGSRMSVEVSNFTGWSREGEEMRFPQQGMFSFPVIHRT